MAVSLDPSDVRLTLSTASTPADDLDAGGLVRWVATFSRVDEDGRLVEQVGHAHLVALPLAELAAPPVELLDEENSDLGVIGRALFDGTDFRGDLAAAYGDAVLREVLLIVEHCQLETRYRGRGLGPLLLGRALHRLRPGAGLVALMPDRTHGEEVAGKIARSWETLGFTRWRDAVWLLDLTGPALPDGLAQLESGVTGG